MFKKVLLSFALLLALMAPTRAFAAFVCQTDYFPGSNARIKLTLTPNASCSGTTTTYWICEPTSASTSCGIFRYSVPELLNLQSSLVHAADTQQSVAPATTNCTGGGTGCLYYVSFRP
jgi:hypothetical protein